MNEVFLTALINDHLRVIKSIIDHNIKDIEKLCDIVIDSLNKGGKIIFMGNGGSAADSQHLAAEFVGRFEKERRPLPSIALTTDTSILTAIGNDYGFDQVFARQVEALCNPNDVIIGISTSGNSKNIINAIDEGKKKKAFTVGFLGGTGGALKGRVDLSIIISSNITARIQEAHILIGHILCSYCDEHLRAHS